MDHFRDLVRRAWTWATVPPARDPQRGEGLIATAVVWLVAIPYFVGSALYCGILLIKGALGEPFRPDALFAVVCAMMGVMVSVMLGLTFRSGRTLQQSSADQTG
jgi:hypothetical protein